MKTFPPLLGSHPHACFVCLGALRLSLQQHLMFSKAGAALRVVVVVFFCCFFFIPTWQTKVLQSVRQRSGCCDCDLIKRGRVPEPGQTGCCSSNVKVTPLTAISQVFYRLCNVASHRRRIIIYIFQGASCMLLLRFYPLYGDVSSTFRWSDNYMQYH